MTLPVAGELWIRDDDQNLIFITGLKQFPSEHFGGAVLVQYINLTRNAESSIFLDYFENHYKRVDNE